MVFRCWLCPSEFEMRKYLQVHICSAPHRRLQVVCPFCQAAKFTTGSMMMLKSHFKKFHRQPVDKFPNDFFTEANGYFLAMFPVDYKRVLTPADASSSSAKICMELVRKYHTETKSSLKSRAEWEKQWAAAQDEPEPIVDYFEGIGSRVPNESVKLSDKDKDSEGSESVVDLTKDSPHAHTNGDIDKTSVRLGKTTAVNPKRTSPRGTSPRGTSPRGTSPRGISPRGISPRGISPRDRDKTSVETSDKESFRIKKSTSTNPLRMSLRKVKKPTHKYEDSPSKTTSTVPPHERMVLRKNKATASVPEPLPVPVPEQTVSSSTTDQTVTPTVTSSGLKPKTDVTFQQTIGNNKAVVVLDVMGQVKGDTRTRADGSPKRFTPGNISKSIVNSEQKPSQNAIDSGPTNKYTQPEKNTNSVVCLDQVNVPTNNTNIIPVIEVQGDTNKTNPSVTTDVLPKTITRSAASKEYTPARDVLAEAVGAEWERTTNVNQLSLRRCDTEDSNMPIDLSITRRVSPRSNAKSSTSREHTPTRNNNIELHSTERPTTQTDKINTVSIENTISKNTITNTDSTEKRTAVSIDQQLENRIQMALNASRDRVVSNNNTNTPAYTPKRGDSSTSSNQLNNTDNERKRRNAATIESANNAAKRMRESIYDFPEESTESKVDTVSTGFTPKRDIRQAGSRTERGAMMNNTTNRVSAKAAPVRKYSIVVGRPVGSGNKTNTHSSAMSKTNPTGNDQTGVASPKQVSTSNITQSNANNRSPLTRNTLKDSTKNNTMTTPVNVSKMQTRTKRVVGTECLSNKNGTSTSVSKVDAPTNSTPTKPANTEHARTDNSTTSSVSRDNTPTRNNPKQDVNTDRVSTRSDAKKPSSREHTPVRNNPKDATSTDRVATKHITSTPVSTEQVMLRNTANPSTSTNSESSLKNTHIVATATDAKETSTLKCSPSIEHAQSRLGSTTVTSTEPQVSLARNTETPIKQTLAKDDTKAASTVQEQDVSNRKEQQPSESKTTKSLTLTEQTSSNISATSETSEQKVTVACTGNIPTTVEHALLRETDTRSRKVSSVNKPNPMDNSEQPSPKKNGKATLIPEVPPDIIGDIYEHLGTRSWTAKSSQSQAQQQMEAISTSAATTSAQPTRATPGQAVTNVAVPSTVLTPPGTPTPVAVTAALANTTDTVSIKRSIDDDDTDDSVTSAKVSKQSFSCMTCDRTFKTSSSLRIHKRLHSAQRGFTCPRCQKRFLYLSSYSVHLISAHGTSALSSGPLDAPSADISSIDASSTDAFSDDASSGDVSLVDATSEASALGKSVPGNTSTLETLAQRSSSALDTSTVTISSTPRTQNSGASATTKSNTGPSAFEKSTSWPSAITTSNNGSSALVKSTSVSSAVRMSNYGSSALGTSTRELPKITASKSGSSTLGTSTRLASANATSVNVSITVGTVEKDKAEQDSDMPAPGPVVAAVHKCFICEGVFPTYGQLQEHKAIHQLAGFGKLGPGYKRFKCDICPQSFAQRRYLESHKVVHSKVAFPCPLCHKKFHRVSAVKCHTYQAHRKTLETLAKEGVEKAKLLMNVRVRVPRPAMCDFCGSRFETHERMMEHKKCHNAKDGDRPRYTCIQCKAVFGAEWLLRNHVRTVHRERSHRAITQSKITVYKPRDRHGRFLPEKQQGLTITAAFAKEKEKEKEKENEQYSCDFCGNRFTQRRKLTRHINTHLNGGIKPPPKRVIKVKTTDVSSLVPNKIPFRNRYGYGKMGLQNHEVDSEWLAERVNSSVIGNDKFRCKVCKVGFSHQSHLMVHINEWVDQHCKNYSKKLSDVLYANFSPEQKNKYNPCDVCGIFYGCKSSLYRHHQFAHGKVVSVTSGKVVSKPNDTPTENRDAQSTLLGSGSQAQREDERQPPILVSQSLVYDNPDIEIVTEDTDVDFLTQYQEDFNSEMDNSRENSELVSTTTTDVSDLQSPVSNIQVINVMSQATGERTVVRNAQQNTPRLINMDTNSSLNSTSSSPTRLSSQISTIATERNVNPNTLTARPIPSLPKEEFIEPESDISNNLDPASLTTQVRESMRIEIKSDSNENLPVDGTNITLADLTTNTPVPSVSETGTKPKSSPNTGDDYIRSIDTINDDSTFEDSDSNDVNSSDEESIFGDITNEEQGSPMPVGENLECIQCQSPFVTGQSAITCHLCCKRYCLPCSKVSRTVYKKAFRGRSVGLLWMCSVCKPAFPNFMALLRQLAEFEEALNTRVTGVSQRITDAEKSVEVARDKGCPK